jgi:hypothetical protein
VTSRLPNVGLVREIAESSVNQLPVAGWAELALAAGCEPNSTSAR